ncbi:hypothetical protein BSL78_06421 [Apostichopus japonicus]|uniref:Uncharacterized protein n=1 Tax=Stichopus japonicus TaxID=307972 RepID=A0A2G8L8W4_STIJA|nr:hypothetical protein BSL78_06421 [Apostichopus japonicus]
MPSWCYTQLVLCPVGISHRAPITLYTDPFEGGIAKYMRQMAKPTSVELTTMKEVKDYIDYLDDLSVVGFFSGEDDPMYQLYVDTANAITRSIGSVIPSWKKLASSMKYLPATLFSSFQEADATEDDLTAFYLKHNRPLVGQLTQQNLGTRYKNTTNVMVFYTVDWSHDYRKDTQFWRHRILEVASDPEYKDYTFAIADEDEFGKFLVDLGLDDSGNEINVGLYDTKKRYAMDTDDEFSVEGLREFLQDFKDGNLKPVIKSQPKPKDNDGPVRIIVGNTFDKEVRQTEKNVSLRFTRLGAATVRSWNPFTRSSVKSTRIRTASSSLRSTVLQTTCQWRYKQRAFPPYS